jgi:tRNA pseudouridine55 synthase
LERFAKPDFTSSQLRSVLDSFIGTIDQLPPMHSALKKDGRALYTYARAGETVSRQPRKIIINAIELINCTENILTIHVDCSKGTYIRVLAEDLGKSLGCGGYLSYLRRTRIRELTLTNSIGLDELGDMDEPARLARLLPVDRLVEILPALHLSREAGQRLVNGLAVADTDSTAGLVRLYDVLGSFLGVGESRDDGTLVAKRLVSQLPGEKNNNLALD